MNDEGRFPKFLTEGTPLVFLDLDGVMFSHDSWKYDKSSKVFGKKHAKVLNKITEAVGAEIVITSMRRLIHKWEDITQALHKSGVVAPVIGCTPSIYSGKGIVTPVERGSEIADWLATAGRPENRMVILDDDGDMAHLRPWLIRTSMQHGLTDKHVEPSIERLQSNSRPLDVI